MFNFASSNHREMKHSSLESSHCNESNGVKIICLDVIHKKVTSKMSMQNMSYKKFFDMFSHNSLCIAPRNAILLPLDSPQREESDEAVFHLSVITGCEVIK
ncbi:unnamed protein product [Rhizophagus irregularis]|nr:unnamed protein product [Rhizophagus irregularis]